MTEKPTDAQLVALAERLVIARLEAGPLRYMEPQGLRTWEGFGAIQAAMAGRGWTFMMRGAPGEDYSVEFHTRSIPRYFYGDGSTAPDAIVLAACAALGLDKEDTR